MMFDGVMKLIIFYRLEHRASYFILVISRLNARNLLLNAMEEKKEFTQEINIICKNLDKDAVVLSVFNGFNRVTWIVKWYVTGVYKYRTHY